VESLSEQVLSRLSPDGRFPGWAAVVCMVVFPPIGLFIVGLTYWKMSTKVLFGIGGSILWIVGYAQLIPPCWD
jgi:hypothetical protein